MKRGASFQQPLNEELLVGEVEGLCPHASLILLLSQNEGDELTWVQRCQPGEDVILGHRDGTVARYNVDMFRPMSKTAKGLQASKLQPGNRIMGMSTLKQARLYTSLLQICELPCTSP